MQVMFLVADMHNAHVFLHAGIDAANVHSIFEEHYVAPTLDDAVVPWIFHLGIFLGLSQFLVPIWLGIYWSNVEFGPVRDMFLLFIQFYFPMHNF